MHFSINYLIIIIFIIFSHFGDVNARAIETSWFKRAVDQHTIEPDSFVFSVPFDSGYIFRTSI